MLCDANVNRIAPDRMAFQPLLVLGVELALTGLQLLEGDFEDALASCWMSDQPRREAQRCVFSRSFQLLDIGLHLFE
jgi:hypothetical protein